MVVRVVNFCLVALSVAAYSVENSSVLPDSLLLAEELRLVIVGARFHPSSFIVRHYGSAVSNVHEYQLIV